MTPLHAGGVADGATKRLPPTRSNPDVPRSRYSGRDGISLGTAIAIARRRRQAPTSRSLRPLVTFLISSSTPTLGWSARKPRPVGNDTLSICRARASPYRPFGRGLRPDRPARRRTSTCRTAATSTTSALRDDPAALPPDRGQQRGAERATTSTISAAPSGRSAPISGPSVPRRDLDLPRSAVPRRRPGLYSAIDRIRYSIVDPPPAADPGRAAADRDTRRLAPLHRSGLLREADRRCLRYAARRTNNKYPRSTRRPVHRRDRPGRELPHAACARHPRASRGSTAAR